MKIDRDACITLIALFSDSRRFCWGQCKLLYVFGKNDFECKLFSLSQWNDKNWQVLKNFVKKNLHFSLFQFKSLSLVFTISRLLIRIAVCLFFFAVSQWVCWEFYTFEFLVWISGICMTLVTFIWHSKLFRK